ncbi:MAG: sulfatase-like hydrolase/transferase, partial [Cyclobacteriaceae bacterium]|nr:sulfatase-like hydrolase/transferase [Cyclobacteriaceae bacterium]
NVEKHGINRNTVIVFMSDNGQPKQATRNRPLRGHKLTPYEGGVRVPLIVKWPGEIDPGINSKDYIIIEDIFPTFLEIAGVEYKSKVSQQIDGVSFVPLFNGIEQKEMDRPIFWHFPHTYDQPPYSSVRKGDWKLIYHHIDQSFELFNLEKYISESENLVEKEQDKVDELAMILSDFLRETEAGMPVYNNDGRRVPYPDDAVK